jgi:flagellar L-ring protein precursor FlgH
MAHYSALILILLIALETASGIDLHLKKPKRDEATILSEYIDRVSGEPVTQSTAPGSLFPLEGGPLTDLASDYKARHVNDVVVIRVAESTLAQATGTVAAQRSFSASSGISALAGKINTSGIDELFSPHSDSNLKGTGTANSQSQLRTTFAGRVVAVLPNRNMVIEAQRAVTFNQQTQTIILRGLIRPGDLAIDDSISSTQISDLELELKGKGVISDATRQPNLFVRLLLKLVGF